MTTCKRKKKKVRTIAKNILLRQCTELVYVLMMMMITMMVIIVVIVIIIGIMIMMIHSALQ